jgi:hypothetical protein
LESLKGGATGGIKKRTWIAEFTKYLRASPVNKDSNPGFGSVQIRDSNPDTTYRRTSLSARFISMNGPFSDFDRTGNYVQN